MNYQEFVIKNVRWWVSSDLIDYNLALSIMEEEVKKVIEGDKDLIWLLSHSHIYTAGTNIEILPDEIPNDINIVTSGRGGKITYHGPGQRVIYLIINLARKNSKDIRQYIKNLQKLIIETLKEFDINTYGSQENIGIWTEDHKKIASIGIRVKKWVTFHGIAVNINNDLNYFKKISPCGLSPEVMTSTSNLGKEVSFKEFDEKLIDNFYKIFKN